MTQSQLGMLLAFVAAMAWAIGPIIAGLLTRELGVIRFSQMRYLVAVPLVGALAAPRIASVDASYSDLGLILVSSLAGLVLAETCFFQSIRLIGARSATLLQAANIVLITIFGYIFLDESTSLLALAGIGTCFVGILIAISERTKGALQQSLKVNARDRRRGISLGLIAAAGQATGILALRPVMTSGMDPFVAASFRILFAAIATFLLAVASGRIAEYRIPLRLLALIALSGLVSNVVGTIALSGALARTEVAVVGTIAALSPVLIVPLVAVLGHERMTLLRIGGALIAFVGTALLLMGGK